MMIIMMRRGYFGSGYFGSFEAEIINPQKTVKVLGLFVHNYERIVHNYEQLL